MRIDIRSITVLGWMLASVAAPIQSQPAFADRVDELIVSYSEQNLFSGAVLVARGDSVFKKGYGLANHSWEIPNTPETRFQIASLTKSFTALLVMQLAESGDLSVNDPLFVYLPDFPADYAADISIKHLLTHTSGIPDFTHFDDWPDTTSRIDTRPGRFVRHIAARELEFEPGSQFSYSNSNYFLLGVIIERVTGRSYGRALQEQILGPGRLDNTGYRYDRMIVEQMAEGYERLPNGVYERAPFQSPSTAYSAGGMFSTVEDLYRWDRLLYTDRLLNPAGRDRMFTAGRQHYGYGWVIGTVYPNRAALFFKSPFDFENIGRTGIGRRYRTIWHWGSNPGFNALLVRVPAQQWTIIILENQSLLGDPEGTRIYEMAGAIYEMLDDNF